MLYLAFPPVDLFTAVCLHSRITVFMISQELLRCRSSAGHYNVGLLGIPGSTRILPACCCFCLQHSQKMKFVVVCHLFQGMGLKSLLVLAKTDLRATAPGTFKSCHAHFDTIDSLQFCFATVFYIVISFIFKGYADWAKFLCGGCVTNVSYSTKKFQFCLGVDT
jgi:hypothetical protein